MLPALYKATHDTAIIDQLMNQEQFYNKCIANNSCMLFFGKNGLRKEDFPKLRERFDFVIKNAKKNPDDFDDYYKKELENISMQVLELPAEEALEKALEMIETSAKFELIRKDVVRGLLDGTL